ncbi:dnaJ (Hsp40) homolog, subfamily C, member 30b [Thalassophryne amazonica]|uniref:dnaJ (Hsp40) homolog, subfamily C, member 30b n=1 Tax=Thalassophryne amazonica TaxID=390379 RepID=UPI0014721289|nr:dnaJ (Hsp40) homolog, subfamily C, member 30b [Thalassophryne amazonica]
MTEVGRRLRHVYRLSAVTNGLRRPASLSLDFIQESSSIGRRETKSKAGRDKYYKVRKRVNGYGGAGGIFPHHTCLTTDWSPLALDYSSGRIQGLKAALQPVLLNRGWGCPGAFLKSAQQLRAFCTVHFILSEGQRSAQRHGRPRRHCRDPSQPARSYSGEQDKFLLYRSRTAYYDILSVSRSSTQAQIKTAYYKQSFIYHPDKNPDNKEATHRFSQISEAYIVLGNINLRRRYDRGILSQFDIQNAGKPSSKDTSGKTAEAPLQHQQRVKPVSQFGGKPMFDFDAFYQAHYGEQLQREQEWRARKQRFKEQKKDNTLNSKGWVAMHVGVCVVGLMFLLGMK